MSIIRQFFSNTLWKISHRCWRWQEVAWLAWTFPFAISQTEIKCIDYKILKWLLNWPPKKQKKFTAKHSVQKLHSTGRYSHAGTNPSPPFAPSFIVKVQLCKTDPKYSEKLPLSHFKFHSSHAWLFSQLLMTGGWESALLPPTHATVCAAGLNLLPLALGISQKPK